MISGFVKKLYGSKIQNSDTAHVHRLVLFMLLQREEDTSSEGSEKTDDFDEDEVSSGASIYGL